MLGRISTKVTFPKHAEYVTNTGNLIKRLFDPSTVPSKASFSCGPPFFIDDANFLDDHLRASFWLVRGKPTMYLMARPGLSLNTALTMWFVRSLACSSVAARSPVYVRPENN